MNIWFAKKLSDVISNISKYTPNFTNKKDAKANKSKQMVITTEEMHMQMQDGFLKMFETLKQHPI